MPVADWVERISTVFHVRYVARAGPANPIPQRTARKNGETDDGSEAVPAPP